MTDSTVDHISLDPDTLALMLTYNGNDTLPATYNRTDALEYNPGGPPGPSLLRYDDRGRIILDSPTNSAYTRQFTYGNGYISKTSTDFVSTLDSIFTDKDNVSAYKVGLNYFLYRFTYSDYPNPFYFPKLAGAGAIFYSDGRDTYSKNLFSTKVTGGSYFPTPRTYVYSWILNTDGQVVSGIGSDQSTGRPVEYYRFVYRK